MMKRRFVGHILGLDPRLDTGRAACCFFCQRLLFATQLPGMFWSVLVTGVRASFDWFHAVVPSVWLRGSGLITSHHFMPRRRRTASVAALDICRTLCKAKRNRHYGLAVLCELPAENVGLFVEHGIDLTGCGAGNGRTFIGRTHLRRQCHHGRGFMHHAATCDHQNHCCSCQSNTDNASEICHSLSPDH